jgi:Uma2 family endonuclease
MSQLALDPAYRRISVEEFLRMDFGDNKAELIDGLIFMMAGGRNAHNQVQINIATYLRQWLRGSGCRPYGSDQAVRTGPANIRYPDVTVFCGDFADPDKARDLLIGDPKVVIEVLSDSTSDHDQRFKLPEYRSLPGVDAIVMVDPNTKRVRLVAKSAPERWTDEWLPVGSDVALDCLGLTLPNSEIFAVD